jgi:Skp family chaperone for outer membrane proteins
MKKIAIIALSAFLVTAAIPAIAQEVQEKEICQISANSCLNKADILQKKIEKLNAEIKKGDTKYSAEELKMLEQKLQDAIDQMDKMEGK